MTNNDRRAHYRLPIRIPIFLKGMDKNGTEFYELTHTVNISARGACFLSKRAFDMSADLLVSIPAPVDVHLDISEDYDSKYPAKVVRVDNGSANPSKRISVRFAKPLYKKSYFRLAGVVASLLAMLWQNMSQ
jgi:hypothetical protein